MISRMKSKKETKLYSRSRTVLISLKEWNRKSRKKKERRQNKNKNSRKKKKTQKKPREKLYKLKQSQNLLCKNLSKHNNNNDNHLVCSLCKYQKSNVINIPHWSIKYAKIVGKMKEIRFKDKTDGDEWNIKRKILNNILFYFPFHFLKNS